MQPQPRAQLYNAACRCWTPVQRARRSCGHMAGHWGAGIRPRSAATHSVPRVPAGEHIGRSALRSALQSGRLASAAAAAAGHNPWRHAAGWALLTALSPCCLRTLNAMLSACIIHRMARAAAETHVPLPMASLSAGCTPAGTAHRWVCINLVDHAPTLFHCTCVGCVT